MATSRPVFIVIFLCHANQAQYQQVPAGANLECARKNPSHANRVLEYSGALFEYSRFHKLTNAKLLQSCSRCNFHERVAFQETAHLVGLNNSCNDDTKHDRSSSLSEQSTVGILCIERQLMRRIRRWVTEVRDWFINRLKRRRSKSVIS